MPTPLEILLDPISLIVLSMFAGLMLWEAIFPARELPKVTAWQVKGLTSFALFFYLSSYLPLWWDSYLAAYQLFDLSSWGIVADTLTGLLLYEFGVYIWHRCLHRYTPLWRGLHQMHHSAERVDCASAFWFSPWDMIGWTLLGSLVLTLLVGLDPQATTLILLLTTFFSIFQHSNIRTPVWLGYLIQRPESHSVHHATEVHHYNYADLPLFDMLFGTFRNPKNFVAETGFYPGASSRVLEMILAKDVSTPSIDDIVTADVNQNV